MNTTLLLTVNLIMLFVILPFGLYLLGRVFIPILAEKDTFFSSPKLGRIKARRRGGKIISFFGNVTGKGKSINKINGKVENGENTPNSFWWNVFGAYFIGLDEVYKYQIAIEAIEGNDGKLKYTEIEASSIFIEGSYPLTAKFVTKDGVRLRVKFQLKLSTIDAAKALSLPISWTIPVFATVLGASRDFFGARDIKTLISSQNEGRNISFEENSVNNSEFITQILSLNTAKTGNISLEEICGQHLDAINLIEIDFADEETKKAYAAPFMAEQEAQKQIKDAEAYASATKIRAAAEMLAATDIAKATTIKGNAEAGVYGEKRKKLGGDGRVTAQVITAEKQSEMEGLTTLVNGGGAVVTVPADK